MSTHTPGPWKYEAATKTIRSVPANYWLATMDSWDGAVNSPANAQLIAAAPDLLAALTNLCNKLETMKFRDRGCGLDEYIAATSAIAKAKGQS
jgi:hypothetical protein